MVYSSDLCGSAMVYIILLYGLVIVTLLLYDIVQLISFKQSQASMGDENKSRLSLSDDVGTEEHVEVKRWESRQEIRLNVDARGTADDLNNSVRSPSR